MTQDAESTGLTVEDEPVLKEGEPEHAWTWRKAREPVAPNVMTLDGPPVVGRSYLVPTLFDTWAGSPPSEWPMITPGPHSEGPGLSDWHIDYRFLTEEQEALADHIERTDPRINHYAPAADPSARFPGSRASRQFTIVRLTRHPFPPVQMRVRVCRRPTVPPEPLCVPWPELAAKFGNPVKALRVGKRVFCPHQKMDLTHWPRDADGIVICPLHRLRVDCS